MSEDTRTILLIDDETSVREWVRGILHGANYKTLEAADYDEAVTVHRQHQGEIDIVLIDISLPGKNGYELAKSLLNIEPHLKLLFMSGHAGLELCRFYNMSVTDVRILEKPFCPSDLLQRVQYILQPSRSISGSASA
jgi:DNA-binding response OmpR family regulator